MNERTNAAQWSRKTKNEFDIDKTVQSFTNRLLIANRSDASIRSYTRALKRLYLFAQTNVYELEIDQIIDFLTFLKIEKQLNWRTIKIYVAGLRYFYQEMVLDPDLAKQIPYPKEKPSLPTIVSRQELKRLFDGCINPKHKVMFRLMYSSGLRRSELVNLKITDIETQDGKMRIRINNGKGGKDRYTILSKTILEELRIYFRSAKPKVYLFNGQTKGLPMHPSSVRHALKKGLKNSGLKKNINLHILRHCFASHALEGGLNIKTLQHLLGHQSVMTTLIYLHVSDVPLSKAFSPLDRWT
jgi:site-specific recombinase XerD